MIRAAGLDSGRRWLARVVVMIGFGGGVLGQTFHVAEGGSDANPGTAEAPFATFDRARDALRKVRVPAASPGTSRGVVVHAGTYRVNQPLTLGAEDSGTPESPVFWRAEGTAEVLLLGGVVLGAARQVEDLSILERLDPAVRSRVLRWSLPVADGNELPSLVSRGFGRPTAPSHPELLVDGRPMTLARWPDAGDWERIAGIPAGAGQGDDHGGQLGRLEEGFLYQGDRPARWRSLEDVWVHGYWAWDWANTYERIARVDTGARRIRTAPPHGMYGFRKGQRFHFLNVLEELDQPGEWYLDRHRREVYFLPPAGGFGRAVLSLLGGPFFSLEGASHIRIAGFRLEAGRSHGVVVRGGRGIVVEDLRIRNVGNWGLQVDGGDGHRVSRCEIVDTGDGGVSVNGGDRRTLTPAGHLVEDCHLARQGRWSKCYVPAILMNGVGMVASHNLIEDHPHCGILFSGNDHRIEFNEIRRVAMETGDVGAIYAGRDYTYRGNRIRHNYIHHTGGVGMGSMGVYMDDCVSGAEISGNVFFQVQRAVFLGGGRDHVVTNNLFVACRPAVEFDARGLDARPVWRNMVDVTMREGLAAVPADLYRSRYPALKDLDAHYGPAGAARTGQAFAGVPAENNRVAGNLCAGPWLQVHWNARSEWLQLTNNLVEPDAAFLPDPAAAGFRWPEGGAAPRIGFVPLAGAYGPRARATGPR